MGLSRRDASEAIPRRFSSTLSPNQYGPLSELDQAFHAFSGALTSAMALFHGPGYRMRFESNSTQDRIWHKNDDSRFDPDRLSRSNLVRLRLAELKASSSPSRPLCFQCGAPGHIANQCRNATLCFVCNRSGHRSPECRSLTAQPAQRASIPYPHIESGSSQNYEVSVRGSIKELEMELTELKQELARVKQIRSEMEIALTGINAQIHISQINLTEIEVAIAARKSGLCCKPDNKQPQKESDSEYRIGEHTKGKESDCTADMIPIVTDPSCSQRMSLSSSNSESVENRSQEIGNEKHASDSIQDVILVTEIEQQQSIHPTVSEHTSINTAENYNPFNSSNSEYDENISQAIEVERHTTAAKMDTEIEQQQSNGHIADSEHSDRPVGHDLIKFFLESLVAHAKEKLKADQTQADPGIVPAPRDVGDVRFLTGGSLRPTRSRRLRVHGLSA